MLTHSAVNNYGRIGTLITSNSFDEKLTSIKENLITNVDVASRRRLAAELENVLRRERIESTIRTFGSTINGTGFKECNLNLFVDLVKVGQGPEDLISIKDAFVKNLLKVDIEFITNHQLIVIHFNSKKTINGTKSFAIKNGLRVELVHSHQHGSVLCGH